MTASLVFIDILLRRQPWIAHDSLRLALFVTCRFAGHQFFTFIFAVDEKWFSGGFGVRKQVC